MKYEEFEAAERALIMGHSVATNESWYSKRDKRKLKNIRTKMVEHEEANQE